MRKWTLLIVIPAGLFLGGCPKPDVKLPPNAAALGGLVVTIEVSKEVVVRGDQVKVTVLARNDTDEPMRIVARTGAPVYVRVWRKTFLGWEPVKRYPEAATMVMNPWTLAAESERKFELNLPVDPDWPSNESIRLTAELNGREEVSPGVIIEAISPPGVEK